MSEDGHKKGENRKRDKGIKEVRVKGGERVRDCDGERRGEEVRT